MPPWLPAPADEAFADERRLSEREIAILARWALVGAPAGDLDAAPEPPAWHESWALGEPDLVLEMAAPYAVPAEGDDIFRNFVVPIPIREQRWVRAVELQPGDARVVHHAVLAVDATPASRQEEARDPAPGFDGMFTRAAARPPTGFFVGWTPGRVARANPHGLAWPLEPGTDLVVQMHLRPHGHAAQVRARIGLYFTDSPPARMPVLLRLGSQTIDIPAGDAAYVVADSMRLPVAVDLLGLYPHAHYLGRIMHVEAVLPTGRLRQLLRIDDWDFDWQDAYSFAEPVALPAGTLLRMRYVYDNSAANPRNPHDPPQRVVYGPASSDEMAELWIQTLPGSPHDLPVLREALARKYTADRLEAWQHLIRLDPRDAIAHANLAAHHQATGEANAAAAHYRAAVEAAPDFAPAHYNLAIVLESLGDAGGAEHHYREAIRSQPDHASAHNNLGNVLAASLRANEAAEHFRRAIELDSGHAEAHNNLGALLRSEGRTDEAIVHYRRVLELQPDAAAARFNLALALATVGEPAEALEHFRRGAGNERSALAVEAHLAMAWILATHAEPGARRPMAAQAIAQQAARLVGAPHPLALDVLAAAHAAGGDYARASTIAGEAIRLAAAAGQHELAASIGARLRLYQSGRPYVERPG